jgi:hypothetical protein
MPQIENVSETKAVLVLKVHAWALLRRDIEGDPAEGGIRVAVKAWRY